MNLPWVNKGKKKKRNRQARKVLNDSPCQTQSPHVYTTNMLMVLTTSSRYGRALIKFRHKQVAKSVFSTGDTSVTEMLSILNKSRHLPTCGDTFKGVSFCTPDVITHLWNLCNPFVTVDNTNGVLVFNMCSKIQHMRNVLNWNNAYVLYQIFSTCFDYQNNQILNNTKLEDRTQDRNM